VRGADRAVRAGHGGVGRYLPGPWNYAPGAVFADLAAVSLAGRTASTGSGRPAVIGNTSSVRPRRRPRCGAWSTNGSTPPICPGSGRPAPREWLHLDVDATITIDHSDDKEQARPTWKKTFGHHPLLVFLDRPEIAGGEALAGLLRPVMPGPTPPPTTSPSLGGR
jgi:hypothetical protein